MLLNCSYLNELLFILNLVIDNCERLLPINNSKISEEKCFNCFCVFILDNRNIFNEIHPQTVTICLIGIEAYMIIY